MHDQRRNDASCGIRALPPDRTVVNGRMWGDHRVKDENIWKIWEIVDFLGPHLDSISPWILNGYQAARCPKWLRPDFHSLSTRRKSRHRRIITHHHLVRPPLWYSVMAFISDALFDVFMYFRIGNRNAPQEVMVVSQSGDCKRTACSDLMPCPEGKLRICAISDTHNRHRCITVPKCDILIHTGDILMTSRFRSEDSYISHYHDFADWLSEQQAEHIIVIGGNHDGPLENMTSNEVSSTIFKNSPNIHYLCNSHVDIAGYRFIGTPLSRGNSPNSGFQSKSFKSATETYFSQSAGREGSSSSSSSSSSREKQRESEGDPRNDTQQEVSMLPIALLTHGTCESLLNGIIHATAGNGNNGKTPTPTSTPTLVAHFYGHYHAMYGAKRIYQYNNNNNNLGTGGGSGGTGSHLSVCSSIMDSKYNPSNVPICVDL